MKVLEDTLGKLGFTPGDGGYRHNGMAATRDNRWLILHTPAPRNSNLLDRQESPPGLWKHVQTNGDAHLEFQLPLPALLQREVWDEETGESVDAVAAAVEWARATAHGDVPPTWQAPLRQEVECLIPKESLTLQTGPFVCQGQLHCEDKRLGVEYPMVRAVPANLPAARRDWLAVVLADAQNLARMARVALRATGEGTQSIVVEADLTGVPHCVMPDLMRIANDAARHVVSRYVWTTELLVDPAVTSAVWEIPPVQVAPAKGGQL